jgi:4-hydroxybenzoate polyprenyltransferase
LLHLTASPDYWLAYLRLARLDRPVGTLLLLWPTLAALFLATDGLPDLRLLAIFALGTVLMRSAGCVINDILDRNHDALVERTRNRPLPAGDLRILEAVTFLAALLLASLSVALMLSWTTLGVACAGLLVTAVYPLMKRLTYLPQVVLGVAFSWGLLMAWTEVQGSIPQEGWLLFIGSLIWIVAYDTWYAMVDRDDDLKAGIRSTAILFGALDRDVIGLLQIIALAVFALFGWQTESGIFWYAGLVGMGATFWFQRRLTIRRDKTACFKAFANNVWSGFALFSGAVIDRTLWPWISNLAHVG